MPRPSNMTQAEYDARLNYIADWLMRQAERFQISPAGEPAERRTRSTAAAGREIGPRRKAGSAR